MCVCSRTHKPSSCDCVLVVSHLVVDHKNNGLETEALCWQRLRRDAVWVVSVSMRV